MSGFSDVGIPTGGSGVGPTVTDWNLAWAIHAGLSYTINEHLKLEIAYRYLNMGSVQGPINCIGGCNPDSYRFHALKSQDLMLGFRWMFKAAGLCRAAIRRSGAAVHGAGAADDGPGPADDGSGAATVDAGIGGSHDAYAAYKRQASRLNAAANRKWRLPSSACSLARIAALLRHRT